MDELILLAVSGSFKIVDAASMGAGLRLERLNAITADLSIAQVAQGGQGLLGTGAVPSLLQAGPAQEHAFLFIPTARL
jgi:hypothetical protein